MLQIISFTADCLLFIEVYGEFHYAGNFLPFTLIFITTTPECLVNSSLHIFCRAEFLDEFQTRNRLIDQSILIQWFNQILVE